MIARVLFISSRADIGGGPEVIRLLLERVNGFECHVACPKEPPFFERFCRIVGAEHVTDIPHRSFRLDALLRLRRYVLKHNIDLIHSHGFGGGLYGRILSPMVGRPCVHTFHGFQLKGANTAARIVKTLVEGALARLTAIGIAVSASEQKRIDRYIGSALPRCALIPNGVAVPQGWTRRKEVNEKFSIVHIGRLVPQKAPLDVVAIASAMERKGLLGHVEFKVVGDGPLGDALAAAVRTSGLHAHFLLCGAVADVAECYRNADVYLSTSLDEGLPLTLLEAMARGIPAVVTSVEGNRDVVEHGQNGMLFEHGDADGAVEAIGSLMRSPDVYARIGSVARQQVEKQFNADTMAARYAQCYVKVLAKK